MLDQQLSESKPASWESTPVSFSYFLASFWSQPGSAFCFFLVEVSTSFCFAFFGLTLSLFFCCVCLSQSGSVLLFVLQSTPISFTFLQMFWSQARSVFFFVFLLESTRVSLQLYWSQPGCVCYMAFLQSTPVTVYFPTDFLESTSVNVLLFCWNQHSFLFPCFGINLGQFFSFCFFLAVNSVCSFCYFLQSTPVSFSLFYRELVVILISCRHVSIDVSGGTCYT